MQIGNGCLKTTRFKQTPWDQMQHVLAMCLLEHLRETKGQYRGESRNNIQSRLFARAMVTLGNV